MNIENLSLLVLWILLLSIGQIFFKTTAQEIDTQSIRSLIFSLLPSISFWLAITLYSAATVLWIIILKSVPLSTAHPFSSISFIIVPIAASFFFQESFAWYYWLGVILIIAGMGVIIYATK